MTELSFYTNVPERLSYLCRLLRKAQRSGAQVGVCGPAKLLDRLDAALWSFEPTEFVPHLRLQTGQVVEQPWGTTPILLVQRSIELPHRQLLLNLGLELPEAFEQFERVLEVVSRDPEQVQAGRRRFRLYKELGHAVSHHEVTD